ncbi:MAG TPA: TRAP transporter small permease subunit [Burkholderiales bacterium]|nr:TRAP transporter small permease subunit [Burkholderiales bacterium]
MRLLLRLASAIDRFTERCGLVFAWLLIPLVGAVAWEVVARYAFDAPTTWAYETIYMLYAAMFMLGAAYALRVGAHVRTDFLWEKWHPRTRAAIETIAYCACFFPAMVLFLVAGLEATWSSYLADERSADTSWFPPLWPLKALVPASALLLLLQGVSELVKSYQAWKH